MLALVKREINGFFNNLIAYVVIAVFLLIVGLFLWVFPGGYNILDAGYANLDGFFVLTPFVFLFLIPAITMRFFADERRTGTIEMLITKPVSIFEVVLSKYVAGVVLVFVALLPSLIFFITLSVFAAAPGVDTGGVWGSYLGLFFLGMVFVAVGVFASALTDNQIVAFIAALFLSGFLYIGFEMMHGLDVFGTMGFLIKNLGVQAHYVSMGRGVVDSRDVIYFLGVIVLFISLTVFAADATRPARQRFKPVLLVLVAVLIANTAGSMRFFRLDLTSDKRYSVTEATRAMLQGLDDIVYVRVYLEGDLPPEFRRLRDDTRELLDEFGAWTDQLQYEFIDPVRASGGDPQQLREYYRMLGDKGLESAQVQMQAADGSSQRVIFPGALITYRGTEMPVGLLQENLGLPVREVLHNSSLALEYKLASSIYQLTREEKERIAFTEGHGELEAAYVASAAKALETYYAVDRISSGEGFDNIWDYSTLIFAYPKKPFSEETKFMLDQYLMHGGSILWLVDPVFADMDSLMVADETLGIAWDINLDDYFFRYGARLNPVLVKDLNAAPIPVTTGFVAGQPQINLLPWFFFPVITPESRHMIVNRLNAIRTEFVSSIDTVEAPGVSKTVLLETSRYSRTMPVPVHISLDMLERPVDQSLYAGPPGTVALLLEGKFESLYRNRIPPDVMLPEGIARRDTGEDARMIVVAGGNLISNQFGSDGRPLPLGYDRFTRQTFGNEHFLLNAVNYLTDDAGIMQARVKDVRLRLLDQQLVNQYALAIQLINTAVPVFIVMVFGGLRLLWRKRRYTR